MIKTENYQFFRNSLDDLAAIYLEPKENGGKKQFSDFFTDVENSKDAMQEWWQHYPADTLTNMALLETALAKIIAIAKESFNIARFGYLIEKINKEEAHQATGQAYKQLYSLDINFQKDSLIQLYNASQCINLQSASPLLQDALEKGAYYQKFQLNDRQKEMELDQAEKESLIFKQYTALQKADYKTFTNAGGSEASLVTGAPKKRHDTYYHL